MDNVLSEMDRFIDQGALEDFIARGWVCPMRDEADYVFAEIDVARIRLICELHIEMKFEFDAIDLILSLMDQLYESRSRFDRLVKALETQPDSVLSTIIDALEKADHE
jgi:chaperone modulatory protein CbpM